MIINLKRVAKIIEEKKSNPVAKEVHISQDFGTFNHSTLHTSFRPKPGQLNPLWHEFDKVKVERAKLSNQLFDKVKGGASSEELKILVDSIKDFQPRLEHLFDQARHVDQYGKLPVLEEKKAEPADTWLLKDQKRKLIDKRSKLQKKLNAGSQWILQMNSDGSVELDAKKKAISSKVHKQEQWQEELDEVNAEYKFIDEQLKKIEGKL